MQDIRFRVLLTTARFKEIATVYGENLNFEDKSSTAFSKNYYRVTPIYNVGGTVVTGKNYIDIAF